MEVPDYIRRAMVAAGLDPDAMGEPVDPDASPQLQVPVETVAVEDEFEGTFGSQ